MSVIKVLPENIANRIAAGEVIVRPASVVKELVENSLDAKATKITVRIENAGEKLISVADNGSGMDSDDILLCLEQHATSKIKEPEDIDCIVSYGFRGEALPSVASVSRFTARSRLYDADEGYEVNVNGGRFLACLPTGMAPGTEMIVKNLFFNTPARKKFLKTKATEEKHIIETVFALSLPFPKVSFELFIDNRQIFISPAHASLMPRIKSYMGNAVANALLPVSYGDAGIKLNGYISRHGFTRPSRRDQRVFVNGRAVDSPAVYRGIRDGYGSLVEKGRFPLVVLFIALDPTLVDVNVHPAKREVRFRQERILSRVISEAVRQILKNNSKMKVSVDSSISLNQILMGAEVYYQEQPEQLSFEMQTRPESISDDEKAFYDFMNCTDKNSSAEELEVVYKPEMKDKKKIVELESQVNLKQTVVDSIISGESSYDKVFFQGLKVIGFVADTYLLATNKADGLIIIDQHAAHERILYEKIIAETSTNSSTSQALLIAEPVELSAAEAHFLVKYKRYFQQLGFDVEELGGQVFMLNGIPHGMDKEKAKLIFNELLVQLLDEGKIRRKFDLDAVAMAACKAAVKAHDKLDLSQAKNLLKMMGECEIPFACPHGRPTIIEFSLKDLEKKFHRR